MIEELSNLPGVSSGEGPVRDFLRQRLQGAVDEMRVDTMGNLICVKRSSSSGADSRRVMIAAHMDEVGLMIIHIESSGHLRFRAVGGIDSRVLASKVVHVGPNLVPGVIGIKAVHLTRGKDRSKAIPIDQLYIDIGARDKADAESAVKVGDLAAFATRYAAMGDVVKGKALDDRVGCALVAQALLAGPYPCDVYGVFTVQEEVGLRGAQAAAYSVAPQMAFALEAATCDDTPKERDESPTCRLGAGMAISVADKTTFYDRRLVQFVADTARAQGLPFQMKQPFIGGTDAGRIHLSRGGVPSACLAVPCRYLHSPVNVMSLRDMESTGAILIAALQRVNEVPS
jgi:endoglucanase